MTQQYLFGTSKEAKILINRVKDGHQKIWERWHLIRQMPEGSGRDKYLAGWDNAVKRLRGLAKELAALGYKECIYKGMKLEDPCLVCTVPNELFEKGSCPAWEIELEGGSGG